MGMAGTEARGTTATCGVSVGFAMHLYGGRAGWTPSLVAAEEVATRTEDFDEPSDVPQPPRDSSSAAAIRRMGTIVVLDFMHLGRSRCWLCDTSSPAPPVQGGVSARAVTDGRPSSS